MKKPNISKDFTVDDINKIREYNADRRKNLSLKERLNDIKKSADKCEKDINKFRKKKIAI